MTLCVSCIANGITSTSYIFIYLVIYLLFFLFALCQSFKLCVVCFRSSAPSSNVNLNTIASSYNLASTLLQHYIENPVLVCFIFFVCLLFFSAEQFGLTLYIPFK